MVYVIEAHGIMDVIEVIEILRVGKDIENINIESAIYKKEVADF